jgi:hypothetical protein
VLASASGDVIVFFMVLLSPFGLDTPRLRLRESNATLQSSKFNINRDIPRSRRWTDEEKVRIVEESHRDGVTLADVTRRHEISRAQLYDWRYRHKYGLDLHGCRFLNPDNS